MDKLILHVVSGNYLNIYRQLPHPISPINEVLIDLYGIIIKAYRQRPKKVEILPHGALWYNDEGNVSDWKLYPEELDILSYVETFLFIVENDPTVRDSIVIISKSNEKVVFTFKNI